MGLLPPHRLSGLMAERICLFHPPTDLNRDVHHPDDPTLLRPPFAQTPSSGTGMFACFPSSTPFGLD